MSPFRCVVALAAVVVASVVSPKPAAAQVYVMESTTAAIRVGSELDMGAPILIPAGSYIRAVLPSGKTQTIKGPYTGTVADLAKGQPINESVAARLKTILQTGGSTQATQGATRSIGRPADTPLRVPFSWSTVPAVDGTVCVQKSAKLRLVRAASNTPERVVVVDSGNGQQAEVTWEEGRDSADWPAAVTPRTDVIYYLQVPERPRRQITLRVLERLPAEDDVLAELHRLGCIAQFDAWVRGKLAAGR